MFAGLSTWWRIRQLRATRTYACCRQAANLTRRESGRPDVYLEVCGCGRRHFYAKADSGQLGARGSSLGRANELGS